MFRVLVCFVVPQGRPVAVGSIGSIGHVAVGPAPAHLRHEEVQLAAGHAPTVRGDPLMQGPGSIQGAARVARAQGHWKNV